MKPRLIILVVVAAALAITFALRSSAPPKKDMDKDTVVQTDHGEKINELRNQQKMVFEFPLPGKEPDEPCEFNVNVRVDTSTGKNRLVLEISEIHGDYVELPEAEIWYAGPDGLDLAQSPLSFTHLMNRYIPANETMVECLEVVPAELSHIGGSIGTDSDWRAEIIEYRRARTKNPEKFPPVGGKSRCDE